MQAEQKTGMLSTIAFGAGTTYALYAGTVLWLIATTIVMVFGSNRVHLQQ